MNYKKYVAPAIEIITMQTEGMIAGSPKNISVPGFTSNEGPTENTGIVSFEVEEPAPFELDK